MRWVFEEMTAGPTDYWVGIQTWQPVRSRAPDNRSACCKFKPHNQSFVSWGRLLSYKERTFRSRKEHLVKNRNGVFNIKIWLHKGGQLKDEHLLLQLPVPVMTAHHKSSTHIYAWHYTTTGATQSNFSHVSSGHT